jgi:hypothetical protein
MLATINASTCEANKWAQAHPGADSDALAYVYHSQEKLGCIVSCQPGG